MRILLISAFQYLRGGTERYFFDQCRLLRDAGHDVRTLSTADARNRDLGVESYFCRGVNTARPGPRDVMRSLYNRDAKRVLRRLLGEWRPDVAHLGLYRGQVTVSILPELSRARVPTVYTSHDMKLVCPVGTLYRDGHFCDDCRGVAYWRGMVHRCNRGSAARSAVNVAESYIARLLRDVDRLTKLIVVSDYQLAALKRLGIPAGKMRRVYNPVEHTPGFDPGSATGEYVLYFGRLEPEKGLFDLLAAAEELSDIPFLLLGDGEARPEIARRIRDRGLGNVRHVESREGGDLRSLVDGARVVVVPSRWNETFGLTAAEAMGRGKCVIVSDAGALPELVGDGERGRVFPAGDIGALRRAISLAWNDRDDRERLGRAAHEFISRVCDPGTHIAELLEVYADAIRLAR